MRIDKRALQSFPAIELHEDQGRRIRARDAAGHMRTDDPITHVILVEYIRNVGQERYRTHKFL